MMKKRNVFIVILAGLVLVFIFGAYQTMSVLGKPLGPHLVIQLKPGDKPANLMKIGDNTVDQPEKTSTGVCNNTGSMVILATGFDQKIETPFGADTIRYIKADFDTPAITVVAVPRDIWLETAALKKQNISETTAGKLFYYSHKGATGGNTDKLVTATTDLTQTLYDTFSIKPDYYGTMELSSMAKLIDSVGGVTVNIPEEVTSGSVTFIPGEQQLDGHQAMLYMRALPVSSSEWDRFTRQDLVLIALRDKLLSPAVLPKLPDLIKIYQDSFVTDLSPTLALDLSCLVQKVSVDNIQFKEVSPEMVSPGPEGSMLPNIPVISEFLKKELGQ
jgi:LCP family protein required for cell wall assembly